MSGYAASLTNALRSADLLAAEYALRQLWPSDVLRGAVGLTVQERRVRPELRRGWLWSERGVDVLSQRLRDRIDGAGDPGPYLQIGTLGRLGRDVRGHHMWTDMTIAQAARAGRFAVGHMTPRQLARAEATQVANLQEAEAVFVNSGWARRSVIEDCGVAPDSVHVVYAGGSLTFPSLPDEPRRGRRVLFVGRDWERKGGPLLVEAFALLRAEYPDAELLVVGCRPPTVAPGMTVVGPLDLAAPRDVSRLQELFLTSSCLCHPAGFAPFPNVLVEAAWAGLPAVTIDTGSRSEAVVDGETGYLTPDPDAEQLADAMGRLLADPEAAPEIGHKARSRAELTFSWDGIVQQITDVAFD